MRHRGALLVVWLAVAGCTAAPPPLPESGTTPSPDAPPPRGIRTDGNADGPNPRWIELRAVMPKQTRSWGGWCRQGVWTPLDRRKATSFVTRETWSKLGARAPRRIAQIQDAVFNGVLAHLRPTSTGTIDFVVEVVEGRVDPKGSLLHWQGAEVKLPAPVQRAYRFEGSVPAGHRGPIAVWGELSIELLDGAPADGNAADGVPVEGVPVEGTLHRTRFNRGFVAGVDRTSAEYEERTWRAKGPLAADYDGVLQASFRLVTTRKAAGFRDGVVFGEGIELHD